MAETDSALRLYTDHHGWLTRWLQQRLGCRETAADLAQDTFLRILQRPAAALRLREPRAYLGTIARGLVLNHWRHEQVARAYEEAVAAAPADAVPSPEERQLVIEALEEIARLLDTLTPRTREIFLLSQLEGLPYREIAQRLDISVNAVQKAMIRALTRCYAALHG